MATTIFTTHRTGSTTVHCPRCSTGLDVEPGGDHKCPSCATEFSTKTCIVFEPLGTVWKKDGRWAWNDGDVVADEITRSADPAPEGNELPRLFFMGGHRSEISAEVAEELSALRVPVRHHGGVRMSRLADRIAREVVIAPITSRTAEPGVDRTQREFAELRERLERLEGERP